MANLDPAQKIDIRRDPISGVVRATAFITAAQIVSLGASTTGEISLWTIPKGAVILAASVTNGGTSFATLSTLTASLGITGATTAIMSAETILLANANATTGVAVATQAIYAETAAKAVTVEFTGDVNLSTATGGSPGGVRVDMAWIERILI